MGNYHSQNENLNQHKQSETSIGFSNTNIEHYSPSLPGDFKIDQNISNVINNLPLNNVEEQNGGGDSEESLGLGDIFQKMEKTNNNDNISDTSPFISSEMYNFLMKGGAKKKTNKTKKTSKKAKQVTETSETIDLTSDNKTSDNKTVNNNLKSSEANYMSSSAHTGSETSSSKSGTGIQKMSSVNTSDINLITE